MKDDIPNPVLYFGCLPSVRKGHYLYRRLSAGVYAGQSMSITPWGNALDGGLLTEKHGPQVEGLYVTGIKDGWTVVEFWDRSGDTRPGSMSAFLVEHQCNSSGLFTIAMIAWPEIFARFKFKLRPIPNNNERTTS